MRAYRFLVVLAWVVCAFLAGIGRADDFDAATLRQFRSDNKNAADKLKKAAVQFLNQEQGAGRLAEKDLEAARKLVDQLYDDVHLPKAERTALIRTLQDRIRASKNVAQPTLAEAAAPNQAGAAQSFGESSGQPMIEVKQWVKVNTNAGPVLVPDGGTLVLGGYSFQADTRNEYGVPGLGKIPYLSRGVRNVGASSVSGSSRISISVRVIRMEEEEARFLGKK